MSWGRKKKFYYSEALKELGDQNLETSLVQMMNRISLCQDCVGNGILNGHFPPSLYGE